MPLCQPGTTQVYSKNTISPRSEMSSVRVPGLEPGTTEV